MKAKLWPLMADWAWFDRQLIYEWLGLDPWRVPAERQLDPRLINLVYQYRRPSTLREVQGLWLELDFIQSSFTPEEQNELVSTLTTLHPA
jgi:hypothetical protein